MLKPKTIFIAQLFVVPLQLICKQQQLLLRHGVNVVVVVVVAVAVVVVVVVLVSAFLGSF